MHNVILLLGGNLGNVETSIEKAIELIEVRIGKVVETSALYESEPWGFTHAQNFLNQVIEVITDLEAMDILSLTQQIETELGRASKTGTEYEGRVIDIDILFYDDAVIDSPTLTIPHPHLQNRLFTLLPLNEKWSILNHPVYKKSIAELLKVCPDKCWARLYQ